MANTPAWFNEEDYLASKAAQLNDIEFDGRTNWTASQVAVAIAQAGTTPFDHFQANSAAEGTSPNAYFNVAFYLNAKAEALNNAGHDGRTNWTVEDVEQAFEAAGISAWTHFQQHGWEEGLNPSATFNVAQYFADKAELEGISVEEVKAAFKEAGLDPVTHYYAHGEAEGLEPQAAPPSDAQFAEVLGNVEAAVEARDAFLEENETTEDEIEDNLEAAETELADARAVNTDAELAAAVGVAQAGVDAAQQVFDADASDELKALVEEYRAEDAELEALKEVRDQAEEDADAQLEVFQETYAGVSINEETLELVDAENEDAVIARFVPFDGENPENGGRVMITDAGREYTGIQDLLNSINAALEASDEVNDQRDVRDAVSAKIGEEEGSALFQDVLDAEFALKEANEAVADRQELIDTFEEAEALAEALEALNEAVVEAFEAVETIGYQLVEIGGDDAPDEGFAPIYVFDEEDEDQDITDFGAETKDLLYFTTKYTFNADIEAGDNNAFEFFIEQDGDDTLVRFENTEFGSADDDFTTITLTGVDAASLHITEHGFLSLAPEVAV